MKNKILIKALWLSLLIITLANCNNNDNEFTPTLPEATQTGKNTFGCFVDGKLLTPRDGTGTFNSADRGMVMFVHGTSPSYTYNELKVVNYKDNGNRIDFHITDLHFNGEGIFDIDESNCEKGLLANPTINLRCRLFDDVNNTYAWYCSISGTGSITITKYDFDNKIFASIFECSLQNENDSSDIKVLTEGRLDINWFTLSGSSFP